MECLLTILRYLASFEFWRRWHCRDNSSICEHLCNLRLKMSFVIEPQISQMPADFRINLGVKTDCDTGVASTLIGSVVRLQLADGIRTMIESVIVLPTAQAAYEGLRAS